MHPYSILSFMGIPFYWSDKWRLEIKYITYINIENCDSLLCVLMQDMIENVLEIKDTYVREVMTPLVDVVAIDSSATVMDFRNLWVTHQYSR